MPGVELWWLGQAGFRLRDPAGGPTLFCDPFVTRRDDRTWDAPVGPDALAQADLVLVSHEHIDHLDRPSLKAAAQAPNSRFTLVVPRPLESDAQAEFGLPGDRVIAAQPGQAINHGAVTVHAVPACH